MAACNKRGRFISAGVCAVLLALGSSQALAKRGGGLELTPMAAGVEDGATLGILGVGGQGVHYIGPVLRTGVEGLALIGPGQVGAQGGFFGDFVLTHIANADVFLGAGVGLGTGSAFSGLSLYVRPEFGVQWNLGRSALALTLNFGGGIPMAEGGPTRFMGLNASWLWGDFPIRRVRRPPRTTPPPPRRATPRRPRRTPPPPPPPRRH